MAFGMKERNLNLKIEKLCMSSFMHERNSCININCISFSDHILCIVTYSGNYHIACPQSSVSQSQSWLRWRDNVQRPSTKNVIFYSDTGLMVSEHCIQHEKTISSKLYRICTFRSFQLYFSELLKNLCGISS